MKRKVIKPYEIVAIIFLYFWAYAITGNILMTILYSFSPVNIVFVQFMYEMFIMALIIFFSLSLFKQGIRGLMKGDIFSQIVKFYVVMIVANLLVGVPLVMITGIESTTNQILVEEVINSNPLYMFFATVIFAPIVEELVFRGAIYKGMRQVVGVVPSVLASSMSFAIMHLVVSIFSLNFQDILLLPIYIVPGVVLCLLYEKTNNIYAPIFLHLINNIVSYITIISM